MMVLPPSSHQQPKESKSPTTSTSGISKEDDDVGGSDAYDDDQFSDTEAKNVEQTRAAKKKGQKLKGVGRELRWEEMFNRLLKFRDENGHCQVPNRYERDTKLGIWVATQRRQYKALVSKSSKSTPMTVERANRLQRIGFDWAPKDPRTVPWETRFKELVEFVAKHGHAQVPMRMEGNVALSNWVSTQRQEYKLLQKCLPSRLTPDRVKLLEEVGFVWEAKRGAPGSKRNENISSISVPYEGPHSHSETLKSIDYPSDTTGTRISMPSTSTGMPLEWKEHDAGAVEREQEMIRSMLLRQQMELRADKPLDSSRPGVDTLHDQKIDSQILQGAGEVWQTQRSQPNVNDAWRLETMLPRSVQPPTSFAAELIPPNRSIFSQAAPSVPGPGSHLAQVPQALPSTIDPSQPNNNTIGGQVDLSPLSHDPTGQMNLMSFSVGDTNISPVAQVAQPDTFQITEDYLRQKQNPGSHTSLDSLLDDRKPSATSAGQSFEGDTEGKQRRKL